MAKRINVLGDIRAERDRHMLELAFYESPDYRTLIETTDRPIVVGRRGTGKSALCSQLRKYWQKGERTTVVEIVPEEDQVIGLRSLATLFGSKYNHIKAGARIACKYALLAEACTRFTGKGRTSPNGSTDFIARHVQGWRRMGPTFTSRLKELLRLKLERDQSPETTISGLAQTLELSDLQSAVSEMLGKSKSSFIFLFDQLDEGFEPDETGVGLVGGFVHAAVDVNAQVPGMQCYIFLRDNIFKAIGQLDPDYSKNIEGRFLRLHWNEHQLFDLVCARLRIAFHLDVENNRRLWNRCTAGDLQESAGFEKCLRLTLYRPRDVLSLLNEAFYMAEKESRKIIILKDVEAVSREISNTRLDDLFKEYARIVPGLQPLASIFRDGDPEILYNEASLRIQRLFADDTLDRTVQREFAILNSPQEGVRTLYSVGFLGIKDSVSSAFVFCHDGRSPSKEFGPNDRLLIHPCYWIALNLSQEKLAPEEAADIHDEYEVAIFSEAPEIRKKRLGQLIGKIDRIATGVEGAYEFEDWCLSAIKMCFTGPLRNIELHPNKTAPQRRDVVATNQSETGVWRRILDDYGTRQVVFEIKNKLGIDPGEYRQMLSYLHDEYGRLGFIITRDKKPDLYSGPELDWTRELFNKHRILVVKLTGGLLTSLLSKLRSPERVDPGEQAIGKIIDNYIRLYLSGAKVGKASR